MTLRDRLNLLVSHAPDDTLVTVRSLREMLDHERTESIQARANLTLADVAARAHVELFGGKGTPPTENAVRNWIRKGRRGVRLEAFGRPYMVTEEAWERFVRELQEQGKERQEIHPAPDLPPGADAADELEAYEEQFARGPRRKKGGEG